MPRVLRRRYLSRDINYCLSSLAVVEVVLGIVLPELIPPVILSRPRPPDDYKPRTVLLIVAP